MTIDKFTIILTRRSPTLNNIIVIKIPTHKLYGHGEVIPLSGTSFET